MRRGAVLLALCATLSAGASVTNVVDIDALVCAAAAGLTGTNGWTFSGLSSYSDGSLRFPVKDTWLQSPEFDAQVIGLEASVRCSNVSPTRWLYVLDGEGSTLTNFSACAAADKFENKSLRLDAAPDLKSVRLVMTGHGNTGVWALGSLSVVTAQPAAAPEGLCVLKATGSSCVLSWTNGPNSVSNRIEVCAVERDKDGETVVLATDFDGFSAGGNTMSMTDELPAIDPALSGVRVYAQAGTTGICQIASGSANGFLRHSGFDDYSGMSLRLVLKRYPGDNSRTQICYETGGTTNVFAEVELEDEFSEAVVDLSSLPAGAAILVGYNTVKTDHRILLDSMSIVRSGAVTKTPLGGCWIVAAQGPVQFATRGSFELVPKTPYIFTVSSVSADGLRSAAASVETRLTGGGGFCLMLR